jgi:hypothetical protein
MNAHELEVLEATEAFFRAFDARDAPGMESLWQERHPVTCNHPGWDELEGREEFLETWRRILGSCVLPHVSPARAQAHVNR